MGNQKLGAVWLRFFNKNDKGYGFISDDIPELSIAICPTCRGKGFGTSLINYLITGLPPHSKLYEELSFIFKRLFGKV